MSGSPLLRSYRCSDHSPRKALPNSPVRPKVLAPLFASAIEAQVRFTPDPPQSNRTPDAEPRGKPSPGSSGSQKTSPHLHLVPKNVAMLATTGRGREKLLKMVDPQPDWTLDDLRAELSVLEGRQSTSRSSEKENEEVPRVHVTQGGGQRWAWDDGVADFKRPSKPFIMRLDDSDDDEDEEKMSEDELLSESSSSESEPQRSSPVIERTSTGAREFLSTSSGRVEAALYEADRLRLLRVQEELRQKRSQLESAFLEASQASAEKLSQVAREEEARCEMARRSDKHYQRTIAEQRDKHLSAIQRDHEQRSLVEERKIKKEEEALRREVAAREELERQRLAKIEAEKLAAAKAAEAELKKIADAQRAEREKKEAAAKAEEEKKLQEKIQKVSEEPITRVSKEAAIAEQTRKKMFQELVQASEPLRMNPALQKDLKNLEREISKILNQVSATEVQVRTKSLDLLNQLRNPQSHSFVLTTLATKLMSQCETQIGRVPSYAFVFARIVINVSSQVPSLMDAVIAKLNESCMLTVPKWLTKKNFKDERSYYKALGYREVNEEKLEPEDIVVDRMSTYVKLYAAITQTEGYNPHGISNAWAWCARLLNNLPANRFTATALMTFLETAGFQLNQSYPRPFVKLLESIVTKFVPLLQKQNDPDTKPVLKRLETFVMANQFLTRPDEKLTQQSSGLIE